MGYLLEKSAAFEIATMVGNCFSMSRLRRFIMASVRLPHRNVYDEVPLDGHPEFVLTALQKLSERLRQFNQGFAWELDQRIKALLSIFPHR